ncbi:beta-lactamase [Clostridiales bacterium oral taxon 876 str. F0540]|nr:beta-lactamase [Clostridiales bacterium oral taxon 876 str. F0540]
MKQKELTKKMEVLIREDHKNVGGIVVQKSGNICYEKYFNDFEKDNPFHIFSVTKSIISILIGIAVDKGMIESIEQKVLDFFPEYTIKRGEKVLQNVTIKDMLTMTVPYKYKSAPYTKYFSSSDWVKSALDLMGGRGRIGEFRYAPLIGPDVLSGILIKATGKSVLDFATENLFAPLGISVEGNVVFHSKEEQLAWYKDRNMKGWVADPKGVNTAGWGLSLKTRDMAKLGQLYLNHGVCDGKQIVSSVWIEQSTQEHSHWDEKKYGYLWWIIDENENSFAALGDGGNVIYINPKKELVVAISALFMPRVKDRITLIREYIEKSLDILI